METVLAIAAVAVMTALGMLVIHRLNTQHAARTAAHHFSDPVPGIGRRGRRDHRRPAADDSARGADGP